MIIQSIKERLKIYAKLLFNTTLLVFSIELIRQLERLDFINILDKTYLLKPFENSGILNQLDKFGDNEYSILILLIGQVMLFKIHISNVKKSHGKWIGNCAMNYIENTTNIHLMSEDEIIIDINKGKISSEILNLKRIRDNSIKSEIVFEILSLENEKNQTS